ncbi:MAG: hypothetical protein K0U72_16505 [Gammaproteobacteria bacterium]|nr:hypothetical protein [Gammaproteobacteria bacterium]
MVVIPTLQKLSLRAIGAIGASIFLAFFALTYSVPGWVESFAANYIESEAQERIDNSIDSIRPPESDSALGRLAQSLYAKNETEIAQLKQNLKGKVHEQWAAALASVRNLDCECREKWQDRFESGFKTDIVLLQAANDKISDFIHSTYMNVATELKRDIRVFTASNAAVFILLLLASFLKLAAITHLFLPGVLLAISTLVCSYFYVFEQNWLLTIIHNSYLGFAYLAWLGVVFLFLCDIIFNRGRITTEILNAFFNAIGSALSVVPC